MKRIATLSALVLALTLPSIARADDASARAKAEEMIDLLHTEKLVEQIAGNIARQVDEAADHAVGDSPTPDKKAKDDDFKKQADQLINTQLSWTAMKPAVVDLYVKTFTEDELTAIVTFYKTPAGSALLEKMPQLNQQFGEVGQARVNDLRGQLQKAYQDYQKSLSPAPTLGPDSSSPSAPKSAPATHSKAPAPGSK